MSSSSRTEANDRRQHTRHSTNPLISPSSAFSTTSTSSSTFFARATSPTRVRFYSQSPGIPTAVTGAVQSSPSVRFSIDHRHRPISPGRSISISRQHHQSNTDNSHKRTCLCSPTTHPGSFRCAFHRSLMKRNNGHGNMNDYSPRLSFRSLHFRRSAMTNSLVRIGGVEGELVKRALSALIRPSSHQLRRRVDFQPRPSRLSVMSKADDE